MYISLLICVQDYAPAHFTAVILTQLSCGLHLPHCSSVLPALLASLLTSLELAVTLPPPTGSAYSPLRRMHGCCLASLGSQPRSPYQGGLC